MSLFGILQIIIAVIFIYLILSLLASELQEAIASFLEFRAFTLRKSITIFLNEDNWKCKEKDQVQRDDGSQTSQTSSERKYHNYYQLSSDAENKIKEKRESYSWKISDSDLAEIKFYDNQTDRSHEGIKGWVDSTGKVLLPSNVVPNEPGTDSDQGTSTEGKQAILIDLKAKEKTKKSLTALLYDQSQIAALNQYTSW